MLPLDCQRTSVWNRRAL
nr:unnamed protein product [Callosobruchus analis]CAI5836313.1 unnamed protein product [Callosobruchus analis]